MSRFERNLLLDIKEPSLVSSSGPQCSLCKLYRGCTSPKMPVDGDGTTGVLVVGEAPGEQEDAEGIPFVGRAGKELRDRCDIVDADIDSSWVMNAVSCRPPENKTRPKHIQYCRPKVMDAIKRLKPRVIILLGSSAVHSVIGGTWKEDVGPITRWVGWKIPSCEHNAWICPTYHPSYLVRMDDRALDLWFERHLAAAFGLEGRPWEVIPDYESQVTIVEDVSVAAEKIDDIARRGGRVSWDLETNMLKPDHPMAKIVSCAICWEGKVTLAYPWLGPAVDSTLALLEGDQSKLGANLKFEHRWVSKLYGKAVRKWAWDSMQGSHVLDCRGGITSVKFQSYVRFGVGAYDTGVAPYLKSTSGSNGLNRIHQVPMHKLLLYNGMDALLEYKLAVAQMEEVQNKRGTRGR